MSQTTLTAAPRSSVVVALLPIMAIVLVAFVLIGMALPVLPLHVHDGLGLGALMVGVVAGSQFAASLFSRVWSGRTSDDYGPKRTVMIGLAAAGAAGLLYFLSLQFKAAPQVSVAILLAGRAVLGGAESRYDLHRQGGGRWIDIQGAKLAGDFIITGACPYWKRHPASEQTANRVMFMPDDRFSHVAGMRADQALPIEGTA
jgi:MFS family permease